MCQQEFSTMPPTSQPLSSPAPPSSDSGSSGTCTPHSVITTATEVNGTTYYCSNDLPFQMNNLQLSDPAVYGVSQDGSSTASSPGPLSMDSGHLPFMPHPAPVNGHAIPVPCPIAQQQFYTHVPPPLAPIVPYNQALGPLTVQIPHSNAISNPPSLRTPSISTNMEVVWHSHFNEKFGEFGRGYGHQWSLVPAVHEPTEKPYHLFKDSAKVRFCCKCGNGWTSMKGRVIFWFSLDRQGQNGVVHFRLFGQRCSKCNDPEFVHALWYPEEVIKVVDNVHVRVGSVFYGFPSMSLQLVRRQGKPRQQHNADLCQACAEGFCRENFIAT